MNEAALVRDKYREINKIISARCEILYILGSAKEMMDYVLSAQAKSLYIRDFSLQFDGN